MEAIKLNETYSLVKVNPKSQEEQGLINFLKVQRPDAYFNKMVKLGFQSPFKYFTAPSPEGIVIYNGHRFLLSSFGIDKIDETSGVKEQEVLDFIKSVSLPFEPYDYQIDTIKKCLMNNKMLIKSCTSCLDPDTEIDVDIPGYTEQEIKGMLDE